MVDVNQKKTEMIAFKHSGKFVPVVIQLSEDTILCSTEKIKALGVGLDVKLQWNDHAREVRSRILKIINGLKIIGRKVNEQQILTVVTSQKFSIPYYASPVWLTPSTSKEVEKLHNRALRIVACDHKQRVSRDIISKKTNRLLPKLWLSFAAARILMKIWSSRSPNKLRVNFYKKKQPREIGLLFDPNNST